MPNRNMKQWLTVLSPNPNRKHRRLRRWIFQIHWTITQLERNPNSNPHTKPPNHPPTNNTRIPHMDNTTNIHNHNSNRNNNQKEVFSQQQQKQK